jgi:hypothetical protein
MYAKIQGPNLFLYRSLQENHPSCTISLYEIKYEISKLNSFVLELYHKYDFRKLLITTLKPELHTSARPESARELQMWFYQIGHYSKKEEKNWIEIDDR